MQLQKPASGFVSSAQRSRPTLPARISLQAVKDQVVTTAAPGSEEIYLGFPKNDYAPREGRKGRVIVDNPKKYPAKDNMGFFLGATGGWAGGEASLLKLRESIKAEIASDSTPKAAAPAKASKPSTVDAQGVPIYLGFGKDELELRKSGVQGRVIIDTPNKYPAKEDIGFLPGATGGFAGGERGLKGFVETGEVRIRRPGEPGGQPMSPLSIAFLVLIAGAGGAVLLSQFYDAGEGSFKPEFLQQVTSFNAFGEFEVNMATGAAALLAVGGGIVVTRSIAQSLQSTIVDAGKEALVTGTKLAVYGIFLASVFLAARAVLEV